MYGFLLRNASSASPLPKPKSLSYHAFLSCPACEPRAGKLGRLARSLDGWWVTAPRPDIPDIPLAQAAIPSRKGTVPRPASWGHTCALTHPPRTRHQRGRDPSLEGIPTSEEQGGGGRGIEGKAGPPRVLTNGGG